MDIQLSKYVACICEGSAEQAIIDQLKFQMVNIHSLIYYDDLKT